MPCPKWLRAIVDSGHSRFPHKDTRDNMVGILHAKDLLRCLIIELPESILCGFRSCARALFRAGNRPSARFW